MIDYILWLRQRVGSRLVWSIGAAAVIRDPQGQLLFIRRGDFVNRWGLPAGSSNIGEGFGEAIRREVREETGLEVEVMRPLALMSSPSLRQSYPNGDQIQAFTVWFACRVLQGELTPDGNESLDVAYFPLQALPPTNLTQRFGLENIHRILGNQGAAIYDLGAATASDPSGYWQVLRPLVGGERLIIPTAVCCVGDGQGRILASQPVANTSWRLPHTPLELGERADVAALHLTERLALPVQVVCLSGIYTGRPFWDTDAAGYPCQLACAAFACHLTRSLASLPIGFAWLPPAALPTPWDRGALDGLVRKDTTAWI